MRSLISIGAAAALVVSGQNKTLEEVYGPVAGVDRTLAWHERPLKTRAALSANYLKHRSAEECDFPLEVVILQDATASFQDDFALMENEQVPTMISTLSASHPGSTFSVVSFRDKPVWSLGEPKTDYCVKFEAPLTSDVAAIKAVYSSLLSTGGGDPSENQFGALVAASQSATPGWSNPDAARIIVVATDAPPHFEADGLNAYGMGDFSGTFDEAKAADQCLAQYYPSPSQVKDALFAREAYGAFLVYDGDYWAELPRDSWEWFNTFIGQDDKFVNGLAEDSSNFWTILSETISHIEDIECGPTTTAAPEPTTTTTTTPTTTTPTTTPAPTTTPTTNMPSVTPVGSTEYTGQNSPPYTGPICPPCVEEPCPPCDGDCCDEVEIKLRHKPKELHLDIVNA